MRLLSCSEIAVYERSDTALTKVHLSASVIRMREQAPKGNSSKMQISCNDRPDIGLYAHWSSCWRREAKTPALRQYVSLSTFIMIVRASSNKNICTRSCLSLMCAHECLMYVSHSNYLTFINLC